MPGLQGESVAAVGSPVRKSKLSLKFLQKKETKRALDFSEPQAEEPKPTEAEEPGASSCDQVVPGPPPCPASPGLPLSCEKKENLVPFVGFNNLGNTCYLNSVLQVLYHCPGLKEGIKKLYNLSKRKDKVKDETDQNEEQPGATAEAVPAHIELLGSFNSLISSVEQIQSNFLLNPERFSEGELATPPRKILNTLRQLNPMYEGYLQHDAQEVLQCILGYIHEACITVRKEQDLEKGSEDVVEVKSESPSSASETKTPSEEDGQVSGKRKSDTEVGNAKKKPKSVKSKKSDAEEVGVERNTPLTRSKRKSSSEITLDTNQDKDGESAEEGVKKPNEEVDRASDGEEKGEKNSKESDVKRKKKTRLGWLRPSGKQPSIFSKFRSVGKISSMTAKSHIKAEQENRSSEEKSQNERSGEEKPGSMAEEKKAVIHEEGLDLMERLFQGQLVLRTRCLECESFTERREDFQDISIPVQEEQPSSPEDLPNISPDPKPELKTLRWAIGQFASVERIVGEDKYFCETCHHYTEAERSLLFDKTPEVITIHLKRFSANGLELDPYAGLSKVNTPLQTPLRLSLDEWCTQSSSKMGQSYQLFAVVMHSGVTISSGHYTAYVHMSDLKDAKLWLQDAKETEEKEEEEVKEEAQNYDDGEVSFSVGAKGQRGAGLNSNKAGGKKLSEGGVGLLGGQRSLSSYDMGNGSKHAEKAASNGATEGSKRRKTISSLSQNSEAGVKKEPEAAAGGKEASTEASCGGAESSQQQALSNLLKYEGKWMLFDDSEVRLFETEDFLEACSPEMSSSSTPYLLFYRRIPDPELLT